MGFRHDFSWFFKKRNGGFRRDDGQFYAHPVGDGITGGRRLEGAQAGDVFRRKTMRLCAVRDAVAVFGTGRARRAERGFHVEQGRMGLPVHALHVQGIVKVRAATVAVDVLHAVHAVGVEFRQREHKAPDRTAFAGDDRFFRAVPFRGVAEKADVETGQARHRQDARAGTASGQ